MRTFGRSHQYICTTLQTWVYNLPCQSLLSSIPNFGVSLPVMVTEMLALRFRFQSESFVGTLYVGANLFRVFIPPFSKFLFTRIPFYYQIKRFSGGGLVVFFGIRDMLTCLSPVGRVRFYAHSKTYYAATSRRSSAFTCDLPIGSKPCKLGRFLVSRFTKTG